MTDDYRELNKQVRESMFRLGLELPGPMEAFTKLHKAASADGILSKKVKELIALALGIALRCDGCLAFHVHDALRAGANRQEILEAIGVAVLMGGGPSVVYGGEAMRALDDLETAPSVDPMQAGPAVQ